MKLTQAVLVFLIVSNALPSISADWIDIPNSVYNAQFDKSNIRRDKSGLVLVWVKDVTAKDTIIKLSRANYNVDYSNYVHTKTEELYDCKNSRIGVKTSIDYDSKGLAIITYRFKEVELEPTIPDSEGENKLNVICNYVNKKHKRRH